MGSLRELTDTSLVTVILPRSGVEELVNRALPNPVQQVLATDARSTLRISVENSTICDPSVTPTVLPESDIYVTH